MKFSLCPGACLLSPHIVARELNIDLDLEKVDLGAGKTETGADYQSIDPRGDVPALFLDHGVVLAEGRRCVRRW